MEMTMTAIGLDNMSGTNPNYWDCECDVDYIHLKVNNTDCLRCGAVSDEQPDSRIDEVVEMVMMRLG